jgi:large subunit ribosomal protein L17
MALGYRRLGRDSAKRQALLRDLVTDLIINEKIETTYHKAKELQRLADKMVTLGKANTLASRVKAASIIRFE